MGPACPRPRPGWVRLAFRAACRAKSLLSTSAVSTEGRGTVYPAEKSNRFKHFRDTRRTPKPGDPLVPGGLRSRLAGPGRLAECLSRLGTATWALEARPPQGTPRPHQGLLGTRTPDAPSRKRSSSGAEGSSQTSRGRPQPPPRKARDSAARRWASWGGLSHRGGGRCVEGEAGPLEAATRHPTGAHAEQQPGVRKGTGND